MSLMVFPAGQNIDNFAESTLVNNTTLTRTITPPVGSRWEIVAGHMDNNDDVQRTCHIRIDNQSDKLITFLCRSDLAAGAILNYPNNLADINNGYKGRIVIVGGWKIVITFTAGGASAGGTATSAILIRRMG